MEIKQRKSAIKELRKLSSSQGGKITAQQLYDIASADKTSPFRHVFEWNKSVAFDKHNLDLARRFISSVTVVIRTETIEVKAVAYVRDPDMPHDEQGYISVDRVKTDEDCKRDTLLNEFTRIAALLTRVRNLAKYFEMEEEVQGVMETMSVIQQQVEGTEARN
jgi:hypothetical protein